MSKPNFYVLEEEVRSYDVGPDRRIKIRPLLQYLQEAAFGHARQAGDTFDVQLQQGVIWVLARLHVRMDRYPQWEEHMRIETWSVGIESFTAIRDFRIEDSRGPCGVATTQWVLIDIQKRRPVRIPVGLEKCYGRRPERALDDPFSPLPALDSPQCDRTFSVRRDDLDAVDHVNNAIAVECCLEALPAATVEGFHLASVEAAFKKELVYGDELRAETAQVDHARTGLTFLHRLVRVGDGSAAVTARSRWAALVEQR